MFQVPQYASNKPGRTKCRLTTSKGKRVYSFSERPLKGETKSLLSQPRTAFPNATRSVFVTRIYGLEAMNPKGFDGVVHPKRDRCS